MHFSSTDKKKNCGKSGNIFVILNKLIQKPKERCEKCINQN